MNVMQRIERIRKEIKGVKSLYGITSWEEEFMRSVSARSELSDKQEETLRFIEGKVFGDGSGDR